MNDESRRLHRPRQHHPPQTVPAPRVVVAISRARAVEQTQLQRNFVRLFSVIADVQELDERHRATFASVAEHALVNAFGAELVCAESENLTRRAA
jgi:hypothetical protein